MIKCKHENCDNMAEWESFFPDGWFPECKAHAIKSYQNNWVADCYQQRKLGENRAENLADNFAKGMAAMREHTVQVKLDSLEPDHNQSFGAKERQSDV